MTTIAVNELVTYLQQQYNIPETDVMTIGNRVIYNKYKNNGIWISKRFIVNLIRILLRQLI